MKINLDGFTGYLAAEAGFSPNTIDAYRRDVQSLMDWLQGRPADTETLHQYIQAQTTDGMSTRTVTRRIAALKCFFRFLGKTLADDLERPKQEDSLPQTLSREQVEKLIATPLLTTLGIRDTAILGLLYDSGIRASELCALGMTDINLNLAEIRVSGKGDKDRVVPISGLSVQSILLYLRCSRAELDSGTSDRLFLTRTGRAMDRHSLWHLVTRYAEASGIIKDVSPHTLRHCFASHMVSGGADLRTVQELLGHSSVETTAVYISVDADRLKAVHAAYHPRP